MSKEHKFSSLMKFKDLDVEIRDFILLSFLDKLELSSGKYEAMKRVFELGNPRFNRNKSSLSLEKRSIPLMNALIKAYVL